MKRKAADLSTANGPAKKQATEANAVHGYFGEGLFADETVKRYADAYANSRPYKHAVVSNLIDDSLLRAVRSEILDNIHFTPKETDIYKIHQSGDLANLDGLPGSALEKLPSLLKLRDALYSYDFRQWLSTVTGAGALSGSKTDMAVNVYVPGCHLLCHDDVIGSRRVSYILYLTDPDRSWKAEWGGALRLYPTDVLQDGSGKDFLVPNSDWSKVIPPAWNQLSFFAVQPGESFHDVEEVYKRREGESDDDGGRFRMAISGWFHIPQEGEEGFEPGLEEKLAEKSSLQQLQGKADQFDLPQIQWHDPDGEESGRNPLPNDGPATELSESDLEYLLQYMTPNYLTPDTVEELNELFAEESMLQLSNFLNQKFSNRLRTWLENTGIPDPHATKFQTSRPPHKHRYQYISSHPPSTAGQSDESSETTNPFSLLLHNLLPSLAFHKWLALATGLTLKRSAVMARRFRRGLDYQLAQAFEGADPLLEYCLCITPTSGWGGEDEDGEAAETGDDGDVGGYELYMAGEEADSASEDGVEVPAKLRSQTGAGERRSAKQRKADPAVYRAAAADDEGDDGILVSNPAGWNSFSVVLRDMGTLRFVKYVSRSAAGDRWDFVGGVEVEAEEDVEVEAGASR